MAHLRRTMLPTGDEAKAAECVRLYYTLELDRAKRGAVDELAFISKWPRVHQVRRRGRQGAGGGCGCACNGFIYTNRGTRIRLMQLQ